jgi:hypothetical protein
MARFQKIWVYFRVHGLFPYQMFNHSLFLFLETKASGRSHPAKSITARTGKPS